MNLEWWGAWGDEPWTGLSGRECWGRGSLPRDDGGEALEDLPQPFQEELALRCIAVETVQKRGSLQVDWVEMGLQKWGRGKLPYWGCQNSQNRSAALACSVGTMAGRMVRVQDGDQRLHGDAKSAEVGDVETFFDAGKLFNNFQERSRSVQRCTR